MENITTILNELSEEFIRELPDNQKEELRKISLLKSITYDANVGDMYNDENKRRIATLSKYIMPVWYPNCFDGTALLYNKFPSRTSNRLYFYASICSNNENEKPFTDTLILSNNADLFYDPLRSYEDLKIRAHDNYEIIDYSKLRNPESIKEKIEEHYDSKSILWFGSNLAFICDTHNVLCWKTKFKVETTYNKLLVILLTIAKIKGATKEELNELLGKENNLKEKENYYSMLLDILKIDIKSLSNIEEEVNKKKFIYSLRDIYKRKIDYERETADNYLRNYNVTLTRIQNLSDKLFAISRRNIDKKLEKMSNIVKLYKERNYINSFNWEILNNKIIINIKFKLLPVTLSQDDLVILKKCIEEGYYQIPSHLTDYLNKVASGEYGLAISPTYTKLVYYLDTGESEVRTARYPDIYRKQTLNGHAEYNNGYGCLGTFGTPIKEAFQEFDFAKLIAIILQYYSTISPADYAGKNTWVNPIITDKDFTTIIYDNNQYFENNKLIKDIVYNETSYK